jgi:phospholipase C
VTRCGLLAVLVAAALAAPASAVGAARTPIEHFVVLMQENRSFDNYFGTFPGADGIPHGACMPATSNRSRAGCVRPFHLGGRAAPDLSDDVRTQRIQYAGRRMDGFVRAASAGRQTIERSVMGHYDEGDLPFYWNLAREYVLFDRFFASAPGGSVPNHMHWLTGTGGPAGGRVPWRGLDVPTIFDRLEERGISWKFYVQGYDPRQRFTPGRGADRSIQSLRVPLLNYPRYVERPGLLRHIVDLDEYYKDLESGRLPQVAYIAPAGASEHPPARPRGGQRLVRALLTALLRSHAWRSSAFLLTYDDWGGWFDHVRPPRVGGTTYGFRVPALLVSPYVRRGRVDSTRLETASIPRFIEQNWGLRSLTARDARAGTFLHAFDFSRPPRAPRIVAAGPVRAERHEARRMIIYLGYGAALVLGAALIGRAALRPDSRLQRGLDGGGPA